MANSDIKIKDTQFNNLVPNSAAWWDVYYYDMQYSALGIPESAKIISVYPGVISGNCIYSAFKFWNNSGTNIRIIFSQARATNFTLRVIYI